MATTHQTMPRDAPTDELPDDLPDTPDAWEPVTDRTELHHGERAAWVHTDADLRVSVRSQTKPTQMHTPETASDDTGFIAYVRGDYGGQLTYDLGAKVKAYEAALTFMATYPDGDYDVPSPQERGWQATEKLGWEADE